MKELILIQYLLHQLNIQKPRYNLDFPISNLKYILSVISKQDVIYYRKHGTIKIKKIYKNQSHISLIINLWLNIFNNLEL